MNVADSNHVAAELEKIGYGPTATLEEADVVVLNTCVVRQSAEDKAIGKLGSLKPWRQAQSDRTLALMGCMVGVNPSPQLVQSLPMSTSSCRPAKRRRSSTICAGADRRRVAEIERQQLAAAIASRMKPSLAVRPSQLNISPWAAKPLLPPTCPSSTAAATPALSASSPSVAASNAAARSTRSWLKSAASSTRACAKSRCSARSSTATATTGAGTWATAPRSRPSRARPMPVPPMTT